MATWSSFEKDKLIIEVFRDFFKKKEKFVGTYPASELTTIVNLISNLAKKLNIEVDTSAIVDEFEAVLKSKNYNLQEQEDKIMIGGDIPLELENTPSLRAFVEAVAQANPRGLGILLKALERGAFKVSGYESAAPTKQAPKGIDYEPHGATDAPTPTLPVGNLVVTPSPTDAPDDEEEAETDRIQPVLSKEPADKPDEKSVPTDTARPKRSKTKEKEEAPSEVITRLLRGKGVNITKINAFIEDIKALRKLKEAKRPLLQSKLGLENPEYKRFKQKHKDVIALINRLGVNKAKFIEAVAKLIAQPALARQEPNTSTTDASAEPEASTPDISAEPVSQPESAPEPEMKRQTNDNDPSKYKRAKFRIKKRFNDLGISNRASRKFDTWKDKIENINGVDSIEKSTLSTGENEEQKIYLITLDNEEQYALPYQGDVFNLRFAFDEEGEVPPVDAYLKDVKKLAKIKNNKVEEKGKFTYLTETLNESLMLRWKTIAGIK